MQKIYCVEDDESVRELVIYALQSSGFEAQGFVNAEEFFPVLKNNVPDLILLDIMLPGIDGIEILKEVRKNPKTQHTPIIMLTFGVMELIARIIAVLRRSAKINVAQDKATNDLSASNGLLVLNHDFHKVYVNNEEVILTLKEFELLYYLLKNKNIVISRDKIMDEVWDYNYAAETRTVDVHIKTLRHKLGVASKLIETIRGVGYKIID